MASASVPSARSGPRTTTHGPGPQPAGPPVESITAAVPPGAPGRSDNPVGATVHPQKSAVLRILDEGGPQIVYQPQLSLSRMSVEGYECLARFPQTPIRGTENWFARAHELGLGVALEVCAVQRALARRHERPPATTIAVNVSPAVLTAPALAVVLPEDLTGVEIELTEQACTAGDATLRRELDRLRGRGARVAVDDVGTAHSGLRRVLDLAPDKLKLDRALVQGAALNAAKAALIRAVVDLAEQIGATVCAEGVEDLDDLAVVADLGVTSAQGWATGMPSAGFAAAEPAAVRAARDRLALLLSPRQPVPVADWRPHPVSDVDGLLTQLTRVTGLPGLHTLVTGWAELLGAEELTLSRLSTDGTRLVSTPATTATTTATTTAEGYPLAAYPLTRTCLDTRTVIPVYRAPGARADAGPGEQAERDLLRGLGFATVLMVPVVSRDRVIGLLECYRRDDAPWTRHQIRSARTVAAVLGPVLDGLTGRPI